MEMSVNHELDVIFVQHFFVQLKYLILLECTLFLFFLINDGLAFL